MHRQSMVQLMSRAELMPGTLDMLILTTLQRLRCTIAQSIKRNSDDVLTVEEGSLYPALQRFHREQKS